jgi:hypothetical protein
VKEIKSTPNTRTNIRRNMKTIAKIFAIFIALIVFILLFLFTAPKIMEFIGRRQVPEMTPEKAQKLFEMVGGVSEVNQEAGILLNRPQTDGSPFLFPDYAHTTTNAPAIASLYSILKNYSGKEYGGTSVGIWTENGRHIEIDFGNHWVFKRIYIFDPNTPVTFNSPSNWFQVSSNIFVLR